MSADDVGHCSSQQALPDMSSVISSLPDKITELEYSALDKITELFLQLSYVQHFLMYDCGYRKYFRNLMHILAKYLKFKGMNDLKEHKWMALHFCQ